MVSRAYVTLVMNNDDFVAGAAVLAYSIHQHCSHPIVCMVTDQVSQKAVQFLSMYFDRVIHVPLLSKETQWRRHVPTKKTILDQYWWMDTSYTKWNCLSLTEYDRILFLDADMLALSSLDHLFDLPAPAGCFSSPYAKTNPFGFLTTGCSVCFEAIQNAMDDNFVVCGAILLLKPCAGFAEWLSAQPTPYGHKKCLGGGDEQSIIEFLDSYDSCNHNNKKWTHIGEEYCTLPPSVPEDFCIRCIHFQGRDKPWQYDVKNTKRKDFRQWWEYANKCMSKEEQERFIRLADAPQRVAMSTLTSASNVLYPFLAIKKQCQDDHHN